MTRQSRDDENDGVDGGATAARRQVCVERGKHLFRRRRARGRTSGIGTLGTLFSDWDETEGTLKACEVQRWMTVTVGGASEGRV